MDFGARRKMPLAHVVIPDVIQFTVLFNLGAVGSLRNPFQLIQEET